MSPRPLQLRSAWLVIGWALVLLVGYLSLAPKLPTVEVRYFDKIGHFSAYFALMCWFGFVYLRRSHLLIAALLVALGVALESAQWWSGYRQFELLDIVANTAGIAVGWALAGTRFAQLLEFVEHRIGAR